ncbi:MAG: polyprenyl synthetase family protein [Chloroflexi bacterium]|nr:MAG: polyprenyl synthetase family protein [Chloroflexota bacterium]
MSNWYYDTFSHMLLDLEEYIKRYCDKRPKVSALLGEMINHHFNWEPGEKTLQLNGKRSRPLMMMLVAQAICGSYQHVYSAAAGIEIIHNFTLIHDDVMDNSLERRHRPALWAKWNISQAINVGDGLFAMGVAAALDAIHHAIPPEKVVRATSALLQASIETVEGQMLDISFETRMDVTPEEYLTMIYHKSGALIQCSAQLGAILSTDDEQTIQAYADFAKNLGIAFQIQDDYLGVWGNEAITGKSATTDIENRKKSYPVLFTLRHANPQQQDLLSQIYQQDSIQGEDIKTVLEVFDEVDAKEATQRLIEQYFNEAIMALDKVNNGQRDHTQLLALAEFLVKREY